MTHHNKNNSSHFQAFTIVELLVVIIVIAVLAAIVVVSYVTITKRTTEITIQADLSNAYKALENFKTINEKYPSTLDCAQSESSTNACIRNNSKDISFNYTPGSDLKTYQLCATSASLNETYCISNDSNVASKAAPQAEANIILADGSSSEHNCAINAGNVTYCWGYNYAGQVGNNSTDDAHVPVAISTSGVLSGKTLSVISIGSAHTCAIASDSKAYCWGYGWDGELGNGAETYSMVPVAVDTSGVMSGKTMTDISASYEHTCALDSGGKAYCWGYSAAGELGDGNNTNSTVPVAVSTSGVLSGKTLKAISTGEYFTCAIDINGKAYCWGYNSNGYLGNNSTDYSTVPVAVDTSGVLSGKTITDISVGGHHVCVLTSSNGIYCWGYNGDGQLGNNSTSNSLVPTSVTVSGVLSGKTITAISAGYCHTCVVTSDGKTYCWGNNDHGELGNNSTDGSLVPLAVDTSGVLSGKTISSISLGYKRTCVVATNKQAYCWGDDEYGQLGDNSTTNSLIPVAVNPF